MRLFYLNIGCAVLPEVKIKPVVKMQSNGNKLAQRVGRWTETGGRAGGMPHLVIKPWTTTQKTSGLLVGREQVTVHKTVQAM